MLSEQVVTHLPFLRLLIFFGACFSLIFSEKKEGRWLVPTPTAWVGFLSLGIGLIYSSLTSLTTRAHDVEGHFEYVRYILDHHSLPAMTLGWETYQPPFYYICVALLSKVGVSPGDFSYFLFALSIVFFVPWLKRKNLGNSGWIAVGWMGLLPACVFYSARLNNDVPFLLYGVLFLGLYDRVEKSKLSLSSSLWMGLLCALALMTKMSGVVFIWALLPVLFRSLKKFEWSKLTALTLPSIIFLAFWTLRSFRETGHPAYLNTVGMPLQLYIPNDLNRFFGFSLETYLHQVSADPFGGVLRNQISPYLLVTALQGEFPYPERFAELFMVGRVILLLILFATAATLLLKKNRHLLSSGPFALIVAQALFYGILCVQNAFAPIQDARYWAAIFPAIGWLFAAAANGGPSRGLRRIYSTVFSLLLLTFPVFYWMLLR